MSNPSETKKTFKVASSNGLSQYAVSIDFEHGHWCSCRGNLSKVRAAHGQQNRNARKQSDWCKHVALFVPAPGSVPVIEAN